MPVNSFDDYVMSWKPDRKSLKRPIYRSLVELLESDIREGRLAPETKLPPQRELADFLDINFTTVTRAYNMAEDKGLIYAVTGRGTFVAPPTIGTESLSTRVTSNDIVDLGPVSSFDQPNDIILDCAQRVMKRNYADQLLSYYYAFGMPHQIAAGVNWVKQFGINTDTDHLILTSGSQNAVSTAMLSMFEPGDKIAVEEFVYPNFLGIAKMMRLQIISVPSDSRGINPGELEAACRKQDVKGIFMMPTCSNPTSVMTTNQRRHALASVIEHYDLTVIEDDAYAFVSLNDRDLLCEPMASILPDRTVYIASVSKPICSGLRIAYMIFPSQFKKAIESAHTDLNIKTSSIEAEIATEAILSGDANKVMNIKINTAMKVNNVFRDVFGSNLCTGHPKSPFRWLPIESDKDFRITEKLLLDAGVRVYHSTRFFSRRTIPDQYLRVSLTNAKDLKELRTGLEILRDNIKVRQPD